MAGHVTTDYAQALDDLDGETVTLAAFGASLVPPTTTVPLAGIGSPLDSVTTTATWTNSTGRLTVADLENVTATDVAYWVCAYDPGGGLEVVSTVELTDPATYDDETVQFISGVAAVRRDIGSQVDALTETVAELEATVAGLEPGPGGGAALSWEDDGADLFTCLASGDGVTGPHLVRPVYFGGAGPVVAAGPMPVMLGIVQAAHRPSSPWQGAASWYTPFSSPPPTAGALAVLLDHDGSFMSGPAGGLWVYDGSGTLTDTDDVIPDLGACAWTVDP
jgi:hypothetical protein